MKYNRAQLRKTALSVKQDHENAIKAGHAKKSAEYEKRLKAWHAVGKPKAERVLKEALAAVRKDIPIDTYALRNNLGSPPMPTEKLDCCTPATKALDGLVELLDTLADDEITATQLNLAGIKDVSKLLRRPC